MASSGYTKVTPRAPPLRVYGFHKVSHSQLEAIVQRLQKPTHVQESQTSTGGLWLSSRCVPAAPFPQCRRAAPAPAPAPGGMASASGGGTGSEKPPPPLPPPPPLAGSAMQKVVRRLQRPTAATLAAAAWVGDGGGGDRGGGDRARDRDAAAGTRTAGDQEKLLERLQRPTTASRRKLYGHVKCALCEDLAHSDVREIARRMARSEQPASHRNHNNHQPHSCQPEPISGCGNIRRSTSGGADTGSGSGSGRVPRWHSATNASGGGKPACPRLPPEVATSAQARPSSIPLISGLPRSASVGDITRRLHPAAASRSAVTSRSGSSARTRATPISIYG